MSLAFLVCFIASLSTLFGSLLIFFKFKNENKLISSALAFSSGVMFIISFISLIPSSIKGLSSKYNIIFSISIGILFVVLGMLLSITINKSFPTNSSNKLYKVGIFSMIAIIMHNIPEGIVTFLTTKEDIKLGITLAIAIALHNIPEGISISIPIYYSTKSKIKAIFYTFISGVSELFGAILAYIFLSNINAHIYINFMYALIAGIMISLVIEELIPSAIYHYKTINVIYYFIIGVFFMFVLNFVI